MPRIASQTVPVATLTHSERAALLELLSGEFLGVNERDFMRDLEEKEEVILLRRNDGSGEIVGFSTLVTLDLPIAGRAVKGIFSGDTAIRGEFRSSLGFGLEMAGAFSRALLRHRQCEIYYVLMSKGWRTYRVLPFFFREFSPAPEQPIPSLDQSVRDAFGRLKYPDNYVSERGVIEFGQETQRLRPDSGDAVPPPEPDAHTRYFLKINPGYLAGTELVCVARVTPGNFAPALQRLMARKLEMESISA